MKDFKTKILVSESVGKGHPDKICDQISDAILDKCLKDDKNSKVACEVFATNRLIVIGGEITTKSYVDVVKTAWDILLPLGYCESDFTIISNINAQSNEIYNAVVKNDELNAGDQGIVYGYATDESKNLMPLSINIANDLLKNAEKEINNSCEKLFKYDMKSLVCLYYELNKPKIDSIIMNIQHYENTSLDQVKQFCNSIIDKTLLSYGVDTKCERFINNSGKFTIGGPIGDTGLTGRKIAVDAYGSIAKHGGGAFSGKDATKVDRTGAYYARYIAKNIVAAKLAKKCEVQIGYVIGKSQPICLYVDCFNTSHFSNSQITKAVLNTFDFDLKKIIDQFKLREPHFQKYSVYGHFGREELNCEWEKTDKIEVLRRYFNLHF
ncbi:MAG: methionine adenosyltransferase [Malacoplasma sp.]|nr:methionine adenosyltransferase [Malacoplasma sp.]